MQRTVERKHSMSQSPFTISTNYTTFQDDRNEIVNEKNGSVTLSNNKIIRKRTFKKLCF